MLILDVPMGAPTGSHSFTPDLMGRARMRRLDLASFLTIYVISLY
jgi:hypothetical protein